jgi:PAS domain S-box-containing protein
MRRIRVLVADDHLEMLSALVSVIEDDPRFTVVGTAADGHAALRLADELHPDVVLLDVHMPGGGPGAAESLTALQIPPVVVAISAEARSAVVEEMVRAGAVGYLTKGHVGDALPDLLARCASGEVVLASPEATGGVRALLRTPHRSPGRQVPERAREDLEPGPAVGPQIIFGFDATGCCTLSTGSGLKDLGLKPGELVGQNLFDLYRNEPASLASIRRVLSGEAFTVERAFQHRRLWVDYQPVRDAEGRVTGAMGVTTDVTEQRRIEHEARAGRARASLLADLSASLSREVADPEALLRVAIRSVTEAVADVGAVWLRDPTAEELELRAVWLGPGLTTLSSGTTAQTDRPARLTADAVEEMSAPLLLDVTGGGAQGEAPGEHLAGLAKRFALQSGLRVPLRSRGLLLGVIDLARGEELGEFTQEDVSLVTELGERFALALDNALLLKAQREAREELVKFQALADASDNLIAIADNEDRIVYVNPRVHEAGVALDRQDLWGSVAANVAEPVRAVMRHSLKTLGRWSGDVTLFVAPKEVWIHLDVFSLFHPDTGAGLGTAWIGHDVTELRATEAAFRAANSDLGKFKALVEASTDFVAIADLDGHVRYVNPRGRELIGLHPDIDVSTTTIADYLTPSGLEASVRVEQPAVIADGHWEGESTLLNHRGPPIPVAIASFLMRDSETGEPFALATVQRDITDRLDAETALRELAEQRQALLTRLVDAQDAERAQIAADVHDDPVQALAAVDLRLGLLRRQMREYAPALLEALEPLQESVSGATERLRALLFDLEPPDLQHGLTGAVFAAAEEIFEGSETKWTVNGDREPDVPDATRAIAYRIAKEAMINVRKHAAATDATVTIAGREGGLEVVVADDGVGVGAEPIGSAPGHRGLFNMQDRAAVAGGRCTIRNHEGGGTLVTLWLPGPTGV